MSDISSFWDTRPSPVPPSKPLERQHGVQKMDAVEQMFTRDAVYHSFKLPLRFGYALKFEEKTPIPPLTSAEIQEMLKVLKPGDVIMCGNDDSFVHAMLYAGDGRVIHAMATEKKDRKPNFMDHVVQEWDKTLSFLPQKAKKFLQNITHSLPRTVGNGEGVVTEQLTDFLKRSERDNVVIMRAPNLTGEDAQKVIAYADGQVGKPYDYIFDSFDDKAFYCTELVARALRAASSPPKIGTHVETRGPLSREVVANEDFLASPDLQPVWKSQNYEKSPFGKQYPLSLKDPSGA